MSSRSASGFTLIELLVVVAIVGILATLAVVATSSIRQKSRDARRVADVRQVYNALELYNLEEGKYPPAITVGQPLIGPIYGKTYMAQIPSNPLPWSEGSCTSSNSDYTYSSVAPYTTYIFNYCLAAAVNGWGSGPAYATPSNLHNSSTTIPCTPNCSGKCGGSDGCSGTCTNTCSGGTPQCDNDNVTCVAVANCPVSVCGDCSSLSCGSTCNTTVSRDGSATAVAYGTILVNGQCWLTSNVNVGTRVNGNGADNMTNDAASGVQRYCSGDNDSNCTTGGALYKWAMAMYLPASYNSSYFTNYTGSGATAKRQGLCPKGWHLPSDYEFEVMEHYIDNAVNLQTPGSTVFYADQYANNGDNGYRGTASYDYTNSAGARLFCTAAATPYASCTSGGGSYAAPKIPLAGRWNGGSLNFLDLNNGADLWLSSQGSFGTSASYRSFYNSDARSFRANTGTSKSNSAYSIRCIQD